MKLDKLVCRLGFWSSSIIALLVVSIDIGMILSTLLYPITSITSIDAYAASFTSWQMLPFVPSLAVAILFPVMILCVYENASTGHKVLGQLSLGFAVVCSAILGIHYYLQLTVVQQGLLSNQTEGLWLLATPNPHSLFWTMAALGYGFMGISLLAAAPVFTERSERNLKFLFIANSLVGIGMLVGNAAGVFEANIFASFIWGVLFPLTAALLAKRFRSFSISMNSA